MSLAGAISSPCTDAARLAASRAFCRTLTKAAAKNFYYGLKLLPEPKRSAMFVLYAYMRLVDDIADEEDGRSIEQRERDLESWRTRTHQALNGTLPVNDGHAIWASFSDMVRTYGVPAGIFDAVIAGQRQDLSPRPFATFAELEEYCYRVAGVVGLASIHIWGYQGAEPTRELAIQRGVAFQLTNILRDVREDAVRGRVYWPTEDLERFGLRDSDILAGKPAPGLEPFLRFQIERAESYYKSSSPLEEQIEADSRPTLVAMTEIYHELLRKISADPLRVLRERVSLSVINKLRIAWKATRSGRG